MGLIEYARAAIFNYVSGPLLQVSGRDDAGGTLEAQRGRRPSCKTGAALMHRPSLAAPRPPPGTTPSSPSSTTNRN